MTLRRPRPRRSPDAATGPRLIPALLLGCCAFFPYYLRHLVGRPYRRRGPTATADTRGLLARHRTALYDGALNALLDGYAELSGVRLDPRTGAIILAFTRLAFAVDDEYERQRESGADVRIQEVLDRPSVARRLQEWRASVSQHSAYPDMRKYLTDFVSRVDEAYLVAESCRQTGRSLDGLLLSAELDSGGLLQSVCVIIGLLHHEEAPRRALQEFKALGVAGKLADDFGDFRKDWAAGRANTLAILAESHPRELTAVRHRLATNKRLDAWWWSQNCPSTFREFLALCHESQSVIETRPLRLVWATIFLPALLGVSPQEETRGRL